MTPSRVQMVRVSSIWALGLAAASLAGCRGERAEIDKPRGSRATQALSPPTENRTDHSDFDFGTIIARPGATLAHAHSYRNSSGRPVRVVRSVNAKPCCGTVEPIVATTLQPGEEVSVKVTVRVATAGPLQHRALLEGDDGTVLAEYWTLADVRPRVRVEDVSDQETNVLPGGSAILKREVVTAGTRDDPPFDPGDVVVATGLAWAWEGPTREASTGDGLIQRSRMLHLTIRGDGDPGPRADEIRFSRGDVLFAIHALRWHVAEAIRALPPGLVLSAGGEPLSRSIVLRAEDASPFEVVAIRPEFPGVTAEKPKPGAAITHVLRLTVDPAANRDGRRSGDVIFETTHPDQKLVKVSLIWTGPSTGNAP